MIQKYIVNLSGGNPISIDEDELEKVMRGINTGAVVKVRQGLFNPSFFISLTRDDARIARYQSDNQYRQDAKPIGTLPDIFSEEKKRLV